MAFGGFLDLGEQSVFIAMRVHLEMSFYMLCVGSLTSKRSCEIDSKFEWSSSDNVMRERELVRSKVLSIFWYPKLKKY